MRKWVFWWIPSLARLSDQFLITALSANASNRSANEPRTRKIFDRHSSTYPKCLTYLDILCKGEVMHEKKEICCPNYIAWKGEVGIGQGFSIKVTAFHLSSFGSTHHWYVHPPHDLSIFMARSTFKRDSTLSKYYSFWWSKREVIHSTWLQTFQKLVYYIKT